RVLGQLPDHDAAAFAHGQLRLLHYGGNAVVIIAGGLIFVGRVFIQLQELAVLGISVVFGVVAAAVEGHSQHGFAFRASPLEPVVEGRIRQAEGGVRRVARGPVPVIGADVDEVGVGERFRADIGSALVAHGVDGGGKEPSLLAQ